MRFVGYQLKKKKAEYPEWEKDGPNYSILEHRKRTEGKGACTTEYLLHLEGDEDRWVTKTEMDGLDGLISKVSIAALFCVDVCKLTIVLELQYLAKKNKQGKAEGGAMPAPAVPAGEEEEDDPTDVTDFCYRCEHWYPSTECTASIRNPGMVCETCAGWEEEKQEEEEEEAGEEANQDTGKPKKRKDRTNRDQTLSRSSKRNKP